MHYSIEEIDIIVESCDNVQELQMAERIILENKYSYPLVVLKTMQKLVKEKNRQFGL